MRDRTDSREAVSGRVRCNRPPQKVDDVRCHRHEGRSFKPPERCVPPRIPDPLAPRAASAQCGTPLLEAHSFEDRLVEVAQLAGMEGADRCCTTDRRSRPCVRIAEG